MEKCGSPESNTQNHKSPLRVLRDSHADTTLNVAIVGGGEACRSLLEVLDSEHLSRLRMQIHGVSDTNPEAPGLCLAKELGLFTTTNFHKLYDLDINLILEITGRDEVRVEIERTKPSNISMMDRRAVRLLWDLIQMQIERINLEKERQDYQKKIARTCRLLWTLFPTESW